jgi:DNA-binding NtrC family response regulator
MERELILKTLAREGGNRTITAEKLGISVRTLRNKLALYGRLGVLK